MDKKLDLKKILNIRDDKNAITHAGIFHADDVFATALLKIVKSDIEIKRVNIVPENYEGLVYDIGYGEYDHHQQEKRVRENLIPYAAFGLLWEKIGKEVVGEEMAEKFDREFVQTIDYTDNTGKRNTLSDAIKEFNPNWCNQASFDECFKSAVEFAKDILIRKIDNLYSEEKAIKIVRDLVKKSTNKVLVLEKCMPWKMAIDDSDIEFVVYPSVRGGYNLQTVPDKNNDMKPKVELPKDWYGVESGELRKISGIDSITFCHNTGFLASADCMDDVWKMIDEARKKSLKENLHETILMV